MVLVPRESRENGQYPKIGEFKKWKFSFFSTENNSMLVSFSKKLATL